MTENLSEQPSLAVSAMLEQGFFQLGQGIFDGAQETFTACLAVAQVAPAFRGRAWAEFHLKNWPKAASDFERARDLDPLNIENSSGLAMCLAMENKVYEAIRIYEEILAKHPDHVRTHIQLGLLHYKLCAVALGRKHMDAAMRARPTLEERRLIEKTLKEQGELDKNRYSRPDFEALRKAGQGLLPQSWIAKTATFLGKIFK